VRKFTCTFLGTFRLTFIPFGIDDIFDLKLISNCRQITEEIYMQKVEKWTKKWNELHFEKWTGEIIPILYPEIIRIKT
jgi:hypothetical protein